MVDVCDGSMGWPVVQAVGKGGEGAIVILTAVVCLGQTSPISLIIAKSVPETLLYVWYCILLIPKINAP